MMVGPELNPPRNDLSRPARKSAGMSPRSGFQRTAKRSVDIFLSVLALLITLPLLLFVAVAIRWTSRGPVLFKQKRIGQGDQPFVMYKFRTMREHAEEELLAKPEMLQWDGAIFRVKNDPRVTGFGRWLRKYSLDELPQLFNVLQGNMSLVGPRPHLREEAVRYEDWHRKRLEWPPGLTSPWAITRRHEVAFDEWMRLDLQYLEHWSLWLDFLIMLRTIPVVLRGQ